MVNAAGFALPDNIVEFLQGGKSVVIATVDEQGQPLTTIMTWVVARDNETVAIAMDQRGRALQNIRKNGQIALEILGDNITFGARGTARVVKEKMDSSPFPSAIVEVKITECKDHSVPGLIYKGPTYEFAADKQHRYEIEQAVFEELRSY